MKTLAKELSKIPISMIVVICLTLGLAPFNPPHVVQKIVMLINGELIKPVDWFDLILHGSPWLLLILRILLSAVK